MGRLRAWKRSIWLTLVPGILGEREDAHCAFGHDLVAFRSRYEFVLRYYGISARILKMRLKLRLSPLVELNHSPKLCRVFRHRNDQHCDFGGEGEETR